MSMYLKSTKTIYFETKGISFNFNVDLHHLPQDMDEPTLSLVRECAPTQVASAVHCSKLIGPRSIFVLGSPSQDRQVEVLKKKIDKLKMSHDSVQL